jgi:hypothetical protein
MSELVAGSAVTLTAFSKSGDFEPLPPLLVVIVPADEPPPAAPALSELGISTYRPGRMDLFAGYLGPPSFPNSGQFRLEATQSRRVALLLVKLV